MGTLEELADRVKLPAEMEAACAAALEKELQQELAGQTYGMYARLYSNGFRRGFRGQIIRNIFESVRDGDYSVEHGAQKLGMNTDTFTKEMEEAGYKVPAETDKKV